MTTQLGLFTQLDPLLTARAALITVSKIDGDRFQVNICPRQLKEGENPALTVPLCVTGTAAELDADLVPQISSFVAAHIGLIEEPSAYRTYYRTSFVYRRVHLPDC